MGQITLDCPHIACGTKNSAIKTHMTVAGFMAGQFSLFGTCQSCGDGLVIHLKAKLPIGGGIAIEKFHPLMIERDFITLKVSPTAAGPQKITHLPADVAEFYAEAEAALAASSPRLAALGFRATMEQAIKVLAPAEKGNLQQRIEHMKEFAPATLIDAMHQIRFLGNDAAHDARATMEEVAQAHEFIRLFLIYAFQLPGQIEAAKAARAIRKAD